MEASVRAMTGGFQLPSLVVPAMDRIGTAVKELKRGEERASQLQKLLLKRCIMGDPWSDRVSELAIEVKRILTLSRLVLEPSHGDAKKRSNTSPKKDKLSYEERKRAWRKQGSRNMKALNIERVTMNFTNARENFNLPTKFEEAREAERQQSCLQKRKHEETTASFFIPQAMTPNTPLNWQLLQIDTPCSIESNGLEWGALLSSPFYEYSKDNLVPDYRAQEAPMASWEEQFTPLHLENASQSPALSDFDCLEMITELWGQDVGMDQGLANFGTSFSC